MSTSRFIYGSSIFIYLAYALLFLGSALGFFLLSASINKPFELFRIIQLSASTTRLIVFILGILMLGSWLYLTAIFLPFFQKKRFIEINSSFISIPRGLFRDSIKLELHNISDIYIEIVGKKRRSLLINHGGKVVRVAEKNLSNKQDFLTIHDLISYQIKS